MTEAMESNDGSTAIRAVIQGRVQGVGFRHATWKAAEARNARGWVRNLADGTVEAHIEGAAETVAAVEEFLARGPMFARVDDVRTESVVVEGFDDFSIRR